MDQYIVYILCSVRVKEYVVYNGGESISLSLICVSKCYGTVSCTWLLEKIDCIFVFSIYKLLVF